MCRVLYTLLRGGNDMKEKRGTTLAELVIVMAIVAVMSVMVVSFSVLCSGWSKIGVQRYQLVQDQRTASQVLHDFVSYFDTADFEFSSTDVHKLIATSRSDSSVSYTLSYENNTLRYTLPDKEAIYPVGHISNLIFLLQKPLNSDNLLVRCSIYYTLPAVNTQQSQLVGSYVVAVATRYGS